MNSIDLVRSYYDAANKHDPKTAQSIFGDSGEFVGMETFESVRGKELQDMFGEWVTAFPDLKFEIKNLFASGNKVVCENIVTGTHRKPMQMGKSMIQPTGRQIRVASCDVFEIENDKIKSLKCYWQGAAMARQLGLSPEQMAA